MLATLDVAHADARADMLAFTLDQPPLAALLTRSLRMGGVDVELRLLGRSHQVIAGPVVETVAVLDGRPGPLPMNSAVKSAAGTAGSSPTSTGGTRSTSGGPPPSCATTSPIGTTPSRRSSQATRTPSPRSPSGRSAEASTGAPGTPTPGPGRSSARAPACSSVESWRFPHSQVEQCGKRHGSTGLVGDGAADGSVHGALEGRDEGLDHQGLSLVASSRRRSRSSGGRPRSR